MSSRKISSSDSPTVRNSVRSQPDLHDGAGQIGTHGILFHALDFKGDEAFAARSAGITLATPLTSSSFCRTSCSLAPLTSIATISPPCAVVQVGHGIHGDNFAGIDNDDFAAGLLDFGEDVGAENDGVVAGEAGDELAGFALLLGIEAGGGLIENQHGRVMDDGLGDADALPVAFRKLADDGVLTLPMAVRSQHFVDALLDIGGGDALEFRDEGRGNRRPPFRGRGEAFRAGSRCSS